jgi:hypothetical protein
MGDLKSIISGLSDLGLLVEHENNMIAISDEVRNGTGFIIFIFQAILHVGSNINKFIAAIVL